MLERRSARLQQELLDEVGLELSTEALDELVYCRFVEPHEGRRPSYGAVIWPAGSPHERAGRVPPLPSPAAFLDSSAPLDVLRTFADGRSSFVIRSAGTLPALAVDPAWTGTELSLTKYASDNDVTVVQRLASGRVRLFHRKSVFTEEGGIWLARPSALLYLESVSLLVDVEQYPVARAILDMCVHTLSPAGHGATLIWFPTQGRQPRQYLDFSVAITPPVLSAAETSHGPALAHALGQLDRAALIGYDGSITRLNVTLSHASAANDLVFAGGTRHTSAGKYSRSVEDAIVFVVSADGPVTVFYRGEVVTSIR